MAVDSDPASGDPAPAAVRRYLTLLFADLCRSVQLASSLEAEQYADVLNGLRAAYQDIVPRHGGTIVRIQGDGVLAIFGHPEALEDDGRRAVEAALEMHAAARGLRVGGAPPVTSSLRLHTGIHAGLVLLTPGDLVRGRFELMGNTPNIAARLSDHAGADEILVSDETLGPERHVFVTGERRHLTLQGLSTSIAVLPIVQRAARDQRAESRHRLDRTLLFGRRTELERLESALQTALGGHSAMVAISASAGLGKTRLAEAFLHRCGEVGCRVHRGYCEGMLGTKPLQPFIHMLHDLFGFEPAAATSCSAELLDAGLQALSPQLAGLRDRLLQVLGIDDPNMAGSGAPTRPAADGPPSGLRELFAWLAGRQPQVLFVDDWQWADDATHRALDAIRQLTDQPVLTLVATRGRPADDPTLRHSDCIELQPLSDDESLQQIARLLPSANPFLGDQLREYAGGNPLFMEELCHCAADDPEVRRTNKLQRTEAWLNVLIESRVARLQEAQAALVRSAAVIGNVIPTWLFECITGHRADDPVVRQLSGLDFIFAGEQSGTLRFKHAITRDAVYASVGLHQRKALHLRIAQALQHRAAVLLGEDHCEALAYHFGAAGRVDEAARFAELAGDRAMAASALDRAQVQYGAALSALDRNDPSEETALRWNSISQRLAMACVFNPTRDELPIFRHALTLAQRFGDAKTIARANYWLGYIQYALGDTLQAMLQTEQALVSARLCDDDPLQVQVRATLGQVKVAAAEYGPALVLLDEAIAVKRAHRSGAGQAVGLAYSLASKAMMLGDRGQFDAALECLDDALRMVGGSPHEVHASIHGVRAAVLLWQGRWDAAREAGEQAARIGERVRGLFTLSMGRAAAAYADWMLGSHPRALHDLERVSDWLRPRGVTLFASLHQGWLADGYAAAGERAAARRHAAAALRRWRERDLLGGAMACRAMARLEARGGDAGNAARWLARARAVAAQRESAHEIACNALCEGELALENGQLDASAHALDAAARGFSGMNMAWHGSRATGMLQRVRSVSEGPVPSATPE